MSEVFDLNQLGEKWLESKIQRMKNLLKIAEPDEALYREIMLSLGYPKNKIQFLELALMLPFKEIKSLKKRSVIEKALLYRAGFANSKQGLPDNFDFSLKMDNSVWEFKGIRPANYPDKRIKGISYLLSEAVVQSFDSDFGLVSYFFKRILNKLNENDVLKLSSQEAKKIVDKIMGFQGIGFQRRREMFFNIILPFILAFCEDDKNSKVSQFLKTIFSAHPPLSENSITKSFKNSLPKEIEYSKLNNSTQTYFGIHFYMKSIQNNLTDEGTEVIKGFK